MQPKTAQEQKMAMTTIRIKAKRNLITPKIQFATPFVLKDFYGQRDSQQAIPQHVFGFSKLGRLAAGKEVAGLTIRQLLALKTLPNVCVL